MTQTFCSPCLCKFRWYICGRPKAWFTRIQELTEEEKPMAMVCSLQLTADKEALYFRSLTTASTKHCLISMSTLGAAWWNVPVGGLRNPNPRKGASSRAWVGSRTPPLSASCFDAHLRNVVLMYSRMDPRTIQIYNKLLNSYKMLRISRQRLLSVAPFTIDLGHAETVTRA